MAYNPYDPYNQGIGTLDLGSFGLQQQPEENMTVAEAINYGVLPQAKEKFKPDFGGMLDATQNLKSGYTGTTRGDFINALESGAFGVGGRQMFDRNVEDVFEGVDLGKKGTFSWGDVSPQFIGTTDGSFRGNIDIDKGALSPDAIKSLPGGFFKSVGDQSSLPGMGVNEYGYPLMASLSGNIPNKVSAIDQMANYDWSGFDDNIAKNIAVANQMNTTLDNTLDNTIGEESVDPWTSFYGNPELYQGFVERGDPLPYEPEQNLLQKIIENSLMANAAKGI